MKRLLARYALPFGALALLAAVLLPDAAHAQRRGRHRDRHRHRHYDRYDRHDARSKTRGLMLEAAVGGAGLSVEGDEAGEGGSAALRVGYGVSNLVTLYAGVSGATLDSDGFDFGIVEGEGEFEYGAVDLGVEFNFGSERSALRPYVNVGVSGAAAVFDVRGGEDLSVLGGAISGGAGLKYYVVPTLALNGGVQLAGGQFTDYEVDGDTEDLPDELDFGAARLQVGLTWNPFR